MYDPLGTRPTACRPNIKPTGTAAPAALPPHSQQPGSLPAVMSEIITVSDLLMFTVNRMMERASSALQRFKTASPLKLSDTGSLCLPGAGPTAVQAGQNSSVHGTASFAGGGTGAEAGVAAGAGAETDAGAGAAAGARAGARAAAVEGAAAGFMAAAAGAAVKADGSRTLVSLFKVSLGRILAT